MADAKRDDNNVPTLIAVSNADGVTPVNVYADPTTHRLLTSDSATGGAVGGASNLTTVGAVPFVSSPGVLNQDATQLFWDDTNNRLGVGTNAPLSPLHVQSASGGSSGGLTLQRTGVSLMQAYSSGSQWLMGSVSAGYGFALVANGTSAGQIMPTTSNWIIGTTQTEGNFKFDVQQSGSSGTLRAYDQTVTTGTTKVVFRAGAGQSGNIMEVQNSSGTVQSAIDANGRFQATDAYYMGTIGAGGTVWSQVNATQSHRSDGFILWSATTNATGAKDVGLTRNGVGILEVNSGSAGTYRDMYVRGIRPVGVTVANLPAAASNTGMMCTVTDANATTIGTTVAGGGANTVLVWSNGTNWRIFAN